MSKLTDTQIRVMIGNLEQLESEGLSYGIMEGYIVSGTGDEVLDQAIKDTRDNLAIVYSKLMDFEEEIEKGKYDEYFD